MGVRGVPGGCGRRAHHNVPEESVGTLLSHQLQLTRELLEEGERLRPAVEGLGGASEGALQLTRALVQKLSGRDAFAVVILVDKEQFDTRACYHQRPRLAELHAAGAAVYLCRGNPSLGFFHTKTVCIDKRSAYFGNAYFGSAYHLFQIHQYHRCTLEVAELFGFPLWFFFLAAALVE